MANEILVLIKQCQLHTIHARAVDWEPHGSSPTIDMRGERGSWVWCMCAPCFNLSFENSELNCSSALRI